jgi:hypothetical protein
VRHIFYFILLLGFFALADAGGRIIAAAAADDRDAILVDKQHDVIRIIIDGREAARFNADGLQVRQGIEYGGTLTDTGQDYYDQRTGAAGAR